MTSITDADARGEYIAGLRALADLLEQQPAMPLPSTGRLEWQFGFKYTDEERRAALAQAARLMPCRLDKNDPGSGDYDARYFTLAGNLHGLHVELWAEREQVCSRVVTGTREVVKTIPTATEEVTVIEDVVEWICHPLLAEAVAE
jgi:hypothetical protein